MSTPVTFRLAGESCEHVTYCLGGVWVALCDADPATYMDRAAGPPCEACRWAFARLLRANRDARQRLLDRQAEGGGA